MKKAPPVKEGLSDFDRLYAGRCYEFRQFGGYCSWFDDVAVIECEPDVGIRLGGYLGTPGAQSILE